MFSRAVHHDAAAAGAMDQGLQPLGPMGWLRGLKPTLHALWISLPMESPAPTELICVIAH